MNEMCDVPSRIAFRYPGSKFRIAPWIHKWFPRTSHGYVELMAGSASVLLQKPWRHKIEVLNDAWDEIANFFTVMRDHDLAMRLKEQLELTPFADAEHMRAYDEVDDDDLVERARRLLVRSFMSHHSQGIFRRIGFKGQISMWAAKRGTTSAVDWARYPYVMHEIVDRLQGVVIRSSPAIDTIKQYDKPGILFYCDPPYLPGTRKSNHRSLYRHEMTPEDHEKLLRSLLEARGYVVLSGYQNALYRDILRGWDSVSTTAQADTPKDRDREEVLWISPRTMESLREEHAQGVLDLGDWG